MGHKNGESLEFAHGSGDNSGSTRAIVAEWWAPSVISAARTLELYESRPAGSPELNAHWEAERARALKTIDNFTFLLGGAPAVQATTEVVPVSTTTLQ